MNEQLEFKIGEDESPATVSIGEDGAAEVLDKPQAPRVETTSQQSNDGGELDQYRMGGCRCTLGLRLGRSAPTAWWLAGFAGVLGRLWSVVVH
jgi:hypothetical protein